MGGFLRIAHMRARAVFQRSAGKGVVELLFGDLPIIFNVMFKWWQWSCQDHTWGQSGRLCKAMQAFPLWQEDKHCLIHQNPAVASLLPHHLLLLIDFPVLQLLWVESVMEKSLMRVSRMKMVLEQGNRGRGFLGGESQVAVQQGGRQVFWCLRELSSAGVVVAGPILATSTELARPCCEGHRGFLNTFPDLFWQAKLAHPPYPNSSHQQPGQTSQWFLSQKFNCSTSQVWCMVQNEQGSLYSLCLKSDFTCCLLCLFLRQVQCIWNLTADKSGGKLQKPNVQDPTAVRSMLGCHQRAHKKQKHLYTCNQYAVWPKLNLAFRTMGPGLL